MMAYKVVWSKRSRRVLDRLDRRTARTIKAKVDALAPDPRARNPNVSPMKGQPPGRFRLRVGDWRVVYQLFDDRLLILVVAVGPRGSVYDA